MSFADIVFDPLKHPHGWHGHFIKKGEGDFHALLHDEVGHHAAEGHYTEGIFKGAGDKIAAEGAHFGAKVKVGGLEVHDDIGKVGSVDYALKDGEAIHLVTPKNPNLDHGMHLVAHRHADGSVSLLAPTPDGQTPEVVGHYANLAQAASDLETKGGHLGGKIDFKGIEGSPVTSKAALSDLPIGSQIHTYVSTYTKTEAGTWNAGKHGEGAPFASSAFHEAVNNGGLFHGSKEEGDAAWQAQAWAPGETATYESLQAAPIGTHIHFPLTNGKISEYKKVAQNTGSGTWEKTAGGNDAKPPGTQSQISPTNPLLAKGKIAFGQYFGSTKTHPKADEDETYADGKAVDVDTFDKAPVGTVFHYHSESTQTQSEWQKITDAGWASLWKKIGPEEGPGAKVGTESQMPKGIVDSGTAYYGPIGSEEDQHTAALVALKKKLAESSEKVAQAKKAVGPSKIAMQPPAKKANEPHPLTAHLQPVGETGKTVAGDNGAKHIIMTEGGVTALHHISGETIVLPPGSTLHQHNGVKDSFALQHADGTVQKINKAGAVQKAPQSLVDLLDKNYKPVHHVSTKVTVPGTNLTVESDVAVYKSKGTKDFYGLVKNGKVVEVVKAHDNASEPKPAQLKSWQAALDKGTLVSIHEPKTGPITPAQEIVATTAAKKAAGVATKKAAAKAPAKKATVKAVPAKTPKTPNAWAEGLPQEYEVEGLGKVKLTPGQSLWEYHQAPIGDLPEIVTTAKLEANGKISKVMVNGVGQSSWQTNLYAGKKSPTSMAKNGYTPVAAYVSQETEAPLPEPKTKYGPDELFKVLVGEKPYSYANYYQHPEVFDALGAKMKEGADSGGYEALFKALGDPKIVDWLAQQRADLIAARKENMANLDASQKTKTNNALKVLEAAHQIAMLSQKMQTGEPLTDHDAVIRAQAVGIMNGNLASKAFYGANISQYWFTGPLNDQWEKALFAQNVKDIGFNPMAGTHEEYLAYAKAHNCPDVAGFTDIGLKDWTLAHLGAPGTSPSVMEALENTAHQRVIISSLALKADEVAAKKGIYAQPSESPAISPIGVAKAMTAYHNLTEAYDSYSGEAGTIKWQPQGGWVLHSSQPKVGPVFVAPDKAGELIAEMEPTPGAQPIGSVAGKVKAALDASYGPDVWQTEDGMVALGAQGAGNMSAIQRRQWALAQVTYNLVYQYEIEKTALGGVHPDAATHPGSPDSSAGAQTRQLLANWLAQQPWYHGPDDTDYSDQDAIDGAIALGLKDGVDVLGHGSSYSNIFYRWLAMVPQNGLPAPQPVTVFDGPTHQVYNGHNVLVLPGEQVLHSTGQGADFYVVIHKTGGATVFPTPDVSDHPLLNPDAPETYAKDLVAQGYVDVTPSFTQASVGSPTSLTVKPAGVTNDIWNATLGAEQGGPEWAEIIGPWAKAPESDVKAKVLSGYISGLTVPLDARLKLSYAPDPVQRMFAWANSNSSDTARQFAKALIARAEAGEYVQPEETFHALPSGAKVSIPPGAALYQSVGNANAYAVVYEGGNFAYTINAQTGVPHDSLTNQNYIKDYTNGKKVAESLVDLNPLKAQAEGYTFSDAAWQALSDAEAQKKWAGAGQESSAPYDLKQALVDKGLLDKYANLPVQMPTFPVGVRQYLVEAAQQGDTDKLDALVWKNGKGFYSHGAYAYSHLLSTGDEPYAKPLALGQSDLAGVSHWPHDAQVAFAEDHYEGMHKFFGEHPTLDEMKVMTPDDLAGHIAKYIDHLTEQNNAVKEPPKLGQAQADTSNLKLSVIKNAVNPGGMHSKTMYNDQFGETWMGKAFPTDPNSAARVDAEHYANVIGRLFGFHQPATFVQTVPDASGTQQYSYVQHFADALGNLAGWKVSGTGANVLNEEQLTSAVQEHLLDWLISNHDSHAKNLLRNPDGKTIAGIDKGQAFMHYHDDKLAVGYQPNPEAAFYDDFYNAVLNHTIDQDLANRVAERVMLKAYQTQSRHDARFEELMHAAMEKRTNFPGGAIPDKEALIAAAIARKQSLLADFNKFYSDLWAKAGWEWKVDPEDFGKKVGEAHIQNGPQFCAEVEGSKSVGKALMFNAPDLIDRHLMFTTMTQKKGGKTLIGTGHLTKDADAKVTAWLENNVDHTAVKKTSAADSSLPPGAQLPLINYFHQALEAFAKTVSSHAPEGGKNPDGQYNQSTVQMATTQAAQLKQALAHVLDYRMEYPTDPTVAAVNGIHFQTGEQRDVWVEAATQKLAEYEMVKAAMEQQKKVGALYPDAVPFEPVSYTPTEGIKAVEDGKSEPVELWQGTTGARYTKTADGSHYWQQKLNDKPQWMSAADYAEATKGADPLDVTTGQEATKWVNPSTGESFVKQDDGTWHSLTAKGEVEFPDLTWDKVKEVMDQSPDQWQAHGPHTEAQTVEVQAAGKQFKVTYDDGATHRGTVSYAPGENFGHLVETYDHDNVEFQTGKDYIVEYGPVKIRYRSHTSPYVAASQKGLLQIEVKDWDASPPSIDDVFDTLQIMGVDMTPADADSLEHYYWVKVTDVLRNRKEAKVQGSKEKAVLDEISANLAGKTNLSQNDELTIYKNAWSKMLNPDDANWAPQFDEWFGQTGGRPAWHRPDYALENLQKKWKGQLAIHGVTGADPVGRAVSTMQSGGLLSSEERVRVLGKLLEGMSSQFDQGSTGNGASQFVFTRQNLDPSYNTMSFLLDPRAALKVDNYAFSGDKYGDLNQAGGSPFTPSQMFNYVGGNNELMSKHGVPVMALYCDSESTRNSVLARAAQEGLTEVRGIPIADFVVGPSGLHKMQAEIWKQLAEASSKEGEAA